MKLTRRDLLKAGAVTGGLLVANPLKLMAAGVKEPRTFPTSRVSRLFPDGTVVVHSDLHNHSLLSDGASSPDDAFRLMYEAGLDVAALTDHALMGKVAGEAVCAHNACTFYLGINEGGWQEMKRLADKWEADKSDFVAMRGFEWTTGTIGHVNVWFTEQWTDSLTKMGLESPKGLPVLFGTLPGPGREVERQLTPAFNKLPETATMDLFYEWLQSAPDTEVLGGGADGLAGFNHPNLYGNFENFKLVPGLIDRLVSCEAMNGTDDYLFWGLDEGQASPLNACLNAGWRVGMLGVSDEHFAGWSAPKARSGMWVSDLSRDGVRSALESRRFFSTFVPGMRIDASANGGRMGSIVTHGAGTVAVALDIDGGPDWWGREVSIQALRPGTSVPSVAAAITARIPTPDEPVITMEVPVEVVDGDWMLLRVSDGVTANADARAPEGYREFGGAIAYTSPFFFRPPSAG